MDHKDLAVGQVYWAKYASDGKPCVFECRQAPPTINAGEKYFRDFRGANIRIDSRFSEITPVPTKEEVVAMREAIEQAYREGYEDGRNPESPPIDKAWKTSATYLEKFLEGKP